MEGVKRRSYRSGRRKEQAESTRAAILEAARRLFAERGYTATTMEAIAGAAGVATITVYATFQSKRALLARLVDAAVSGDRAPAPIYEQERAQAIMREPDRRRQLGLFAAHMAEIMERVSPLFEVMDHAAAVEPEIADLRQAMLRGRLEGMRVFVRALEEQAPLRPGLTEEEAAQTVWAVTAPQLFQLLRRDLGWESERWAAWVTETLSATLLPVSASAPQGSGES